jgi:hypothetical protein
MWEEAGGSTNTSGWEEVKSAPAAEQQDHGDIRDSKVPIWGGTVAEAGLGLGQALGFSDKTAWGMAEVGRMLGKGAAHVTNLFEGQYS